MDWAIELEVANTTLYRFKEGFGRAQSARLTDCGLDILLSNGCWRICSGGKTSGGVKLIPHFHLVLRSLMTDLYLH
jgi:hypothetical protein